ncbi:MAG TPA: type II toxin-antitoxin system VapC family toxin [Planctomycetaceae bacterium]|jgi:predicted nucleic acid-binding protein|nr:type II toxin-antitoxin system VapC family toxin [Planctomycetaceae bacterium]
MTHLLDTNICSEFLKQPGRLGHRFMQHGGGLCVSTIVLGELYAWAERSSTRRRHQAIESDLIPIVEILDFDRQSAEIFGRLRIQSQQNGTNVDAFDLMIAAVALQHDLTLVTHNVKHFAPVPGLRIEDWLE